MNADANKKPAGFHLLAIDRFMRSSYAVPIVALIAAASIVTVLLSERGMNGTWADFRHVVVTRWRFFALFAVIFAAGGWWTARAWRQLWRAGRTPWERLVYDYGVRGFGLGTAVALTAIIARLGWATDSGGLFGSMMSLGLLAGLFFGTPVALYLGYFWATTMAALTGVERDRDVEVGDPPHLSYSEGRRPNPVDDQVNFAGSKRSFAAYDWITDRGQPESLNSCPKVTRKFGRPL